MNYVVTALDQRYWSPWGASWIASLRELAQTKSKLIILNVGLNQDALQKLHNLKIRVVHGHVGSNIRNHAIDWTSKLAVEEQANCAYFDADCWFQQGIDGLWETLDDRIALAEGNNHGFLAGNHKAWTSFANLKQIFNFMKDDDCLNSFANFFKSHRQEISQSWNCTRMPELKDEQGWLCYDGQPVHVIHPTGGLKSIATHRNLMFHERYPDLFEQYAEKPIKPLSISARRLIIPKK